GGLEAVETTPAGSLSVASRSESGIARATRLVSTCRTSRGSITHPEFSVLSSQFRLGLFSNLLERAEAFLRVQPALDRVGRVRDGVGGAAAGAAPAAAAGAPTTTAASLSRCRDEGGMSFLQLRQMVASLRVRERHAVPGGERHAGCDEVVFALCRGERILYGL